MLISWIALRTEDIEHCILVGSVAPRGVGGRERVPWGVEQRVAGLAATALLRSLRLFKDQ